MKLSVTLFLTFTLFNLTAQETVKVERTTRYHTETFYVLKSNQNIRHGIYTKVNNEDEVLIEGYFNNNEKNSVWTEYFYGGGNVESQTSYKEGKKNGECINYYQYCEKSMIRDKGFYENDIRVGVWEFYNCEGELVQKFDYDNHEVLEFKIDEKNKDTLYTILLNGEMLQSKLDRPPFYIGTDIMQSPIINSNIEYPEKAIDEDISGKVIISFYIDTNGVAFDHQIETTIGGGCDEEALRVVKLLPNDWIPGILNGEKVVVKHRVPIIYIIE